MARIRTIKPEFPQSESMGRVSRESRLCFILLWTIADDSGRLRGASRMLASLLYPYDDDAPKKILGWLSELEREGCLHRYEIDGNTYIQISNWLNHQKIDKPSPSKIPPFDESSRILANPRERSSEDQGSKDQGPRTKDAATFVASSVVGLDLKSWERWLDYRKSIGKPIKPPSLQAAAEEMAKLGSVQTATVQRSIANGYQGLWEPKTPAKPTPADKPPPTPEQIAAARAAAAADNAAQVRKAIPNLPDMRATR